MKNFYQKANKTCKIIAGVLVFGTLLTVAGSYYSQKTFKNIKENIVRLHIVANSDTKEDQNLKLEVRDKVLACVEDLSVNAKDAESYKETLKVELDAITDEINTYLEETGSSQRAEISLGESVFPAKNYGDIVLPAGTYDAIKVTLGEGQGKNWWCVMFPPLCCTNSGTFAISESGKEALKENLSDEAYKTVIGNADNSAVLIADDGLIDENVDVNVRFKIVEIFKDSGNKIASLWGQCKKLFSR